MSRCFPGARARRAARPAVVAFCAGAALSFPRRAEATAYRVDSSFDAQFYTVESVFGTPVLQRRRYTETLGLDVYDLWSADPEAPIVSLRARLRLDADLGQEFAERDPTSPGRFIPGLYEAPLDLMYAYMEGARFFDGAFGFRLGRQYVVDSLGWWSFDGVLLALDTPVHLRLEGYAGAEQRGLRPALGTSRFEADGVLRGDRSELEVGLWPSFLSESALAPAAGFAVHASDVSFLRGNLSYRKVLNRDEVLVSQFPDQASGFTFVGGDRVSTERVGATLSLFDAEYGSVGGRAVYDLYLGRATSHGASLEARVTPSLTLGASYDYLLPTFDADSIFNWFFHRGSTTLLGTAGFRPSRAWALALSSGVRRFSAGASESGDAEASFDWIGSADARYAWPTGQATLRSYDQVGRGSHWVGVDVGLKKWFAARRYDLTTSVGLHDFEDHLRRDTGATSTTYVIGGGYHPGVSRFLRSRFGLEWEHHVNRLVGHRVRVLATFDLSLFP